MRETGFEFIGNNSKLIYAYNRFKERDEQA